ASAAAALAPTATWLVVFRAAQGVGGAIVMPLTLTVISAAVPKEKRAQVVGGAIVDGISWQWIFWVNVPIGIVLVPLVLRNLDETHGGLAQKLDLKGL